MDVLRFNELLALGPPEPEVARIVAEHDCAVANGRGMAALLDGDGWDVAWLLLARDRLYPAAADVMKARLRGAVTIVAAVGRSGQIGLRGRLPWRVPGDLAHFRALTAGGTVLVGRVTFESMGPLKGRTVVAVSSGPVPGADAVVSDPLSPDLPGEGLFVCGGSAIYRAYLDVADRMVLSRVDYDGPADAYFPSDDEVARAGWLPIGAPSRGVGFTAQEFVRRRHKAAAPGPPGPA